MSNIYLKAIEKTDVLKHRFCKFKKIVTRSVFGELRLTKISLKFKTCCNFKIRSLGAICVWLFYYFNFERNYDVLKSKSPCILLNKNINFNKDERN